MSRATVILNSQHERQRVASWAQQASPGTIVEFRQSKRTLDQNARLWACLTEIARKVEWHGMKLPADDWKDIFTAALRKHRFVPGLDANTVVPLGMRTSDMTKQEFGDLLELINAFAAERGIEFQDHQSSDTPADDNGSDDAPTPGQVAAGQSEPADEAEAGAGDIEARDEPDASPASEPIGPVKRMLCEELVDNMLRDAFSEPAIERPAKIDKLRDVFLEAQNLGDLPDFVNLCHETARRVIGKPGERDRAHAYLVAKIPAGGA